MDEAKLICEFLEERIPGIVAAVGYGSEFDKTAEELDSLKTERKMDRTMRAHSIIALPSMVEEFSWKKNENQYDYLIFCEDVKSSFVAAMTTIKECNTPTTKMFVNHVDSKKITAETNVVYMTYIYVESIKRYIKVGFCDYYGTIKSMSEFDSIYIPLRLSKNVYVTKTTPEFDLALNANRKTVDLITGLVIPEEVYPLERHYITAYNLSYGGDSRNGIAEDPAKVDKLIKQQENYLKENYAQSPLYTQFIRCDFNGVKIMVKKEIPQEWFSLLPLSLKNEIKKVGLENSNLETDEEREILSQTISNYIHQRTKLESKIEPIRGIGSNGVLNSMAYLSRKLGKARIKKM